MYFRMKGRVAFKTFPHRLGRSDPTGTGRFQSTRLSGLNQSRRSKFMIVTHVSSCADRLASRDALAVAMRMIQRFSTLFHIPKALAI